MANKKIDLDPEFIEHLRNLEAQIQQADEEGRKARDQMRAEVANLREIREETVTQLNQIDEIIQRKEQYLRDHAEEGEPECVTVPASKRDNRSVTVSKAPTAYRDTAKKCAVCGAPMATQRATKRTCSDRCRQELSRRSR